MNMLTESTELSLDWEDIKPYNYFQEESSSQDNNEYGESSEDQEDGEEGKSGKGSDKEEDDKEEGEEDKEGKDKKGKKCDKDGNCDSEGESDSDKDKKGEKNKPGKNKGPSSGNLKMSQEDIDRMDRTHKEIEEAFAKKGDYKSIEDARADPKNTKQDVNTKTGNVDVEYSIRATTKWKSLIEKMVSKTTPYDIEETRTKLPKNAISNVVAAVDQGTSVLNPAEIPTTQEQRKLIFVVDSSGSMTSYIPTIHSHIATLINKQAEGVDDVFYLAKFSDNVECYACSIKRKNYVKVGLEELYNNKITPMGSDSKSIVELFERTIGGGTILGGNLVQALVKAGKAENCTILISDSDILDSDNLSNLKILASNNMKAQTMGVILPDKNVFKQFTDIFGAALLSFVSHMGF